MTEFTKTIREKSLSQLKRDAKTGNLEMRMVYRYGSPIPERMQGWREVVGSNSVGIKIKSNDGKISSLDIESANLVVYTDNSLTIYGPGLRDLTAEEQRVMDEWQEKASTPEYIKQSEIDALTDGSQTYWQQKRFFRNKNMEYLMGTKRERGMKLEFAQSKNESPKIRDYKVRGDVLIKYEIRAKGR